MVFYIQTTQLLAWKYSNQDHDLRPIASHSDHPIPNQHQFGGNTNYPNPRSVQTQDHHEKRPKQGFMDNEKATGLVILCPFNIILVLWFQHDADTL